MTQSEFKESLEPPEGGRGKKWILPKSLQKELDPAHTLIDFRPLTPGTVRQRISVILSHQCVVLCSCSYRKQVHCPSPPQGHELRRPENVSALFFPITPAISTAPVVHNKISDYSDPTKLSISSSLSPDSNCSCMSLWTLPKFGSLLPPKWSWGGGDRGFCLLRDI